MPFEFPREPVGVPDRDIRRMWEDVWRLVESLRLMEEQLRIDIDKEKKQ